MSVKKRPTPLKNEEKGDIDKFFGQKNPLIFTKLNFDFCFPDECS